MSNYSMYNIPEVAVPNFLRRTELVLARIWMSSSRSWGLFDATTVPEVIVPAEDGVCISEDLAEVLQILG